MKDITGQLNKAIESFLNSYIETIDWEFRPSPEKWSAKEIIGHLTDSAQVNLQRFVRCTYQENFKLVYDQVEWVQAQHYQEANLEELLSLWRLLNGQIIRVLDNYPADGLQAQCDNSKTEQSLHTVEFLALDYIEHLKHHLNQIVNRK
ncbi:DinB family protein [Mucilaginibacter sp.]|uniref:DinB family protein n=1 Tax=Mucilaginibacter sp. TaxID=1882438 RepID=UPI00284B9762|nr:DinB family protein [Mucilaginibacter sp.]MDR3694984.1 DinB family protein [Mucilaginibacter sp.]